MNRTRLPALPRVLALLALAAALVSAPARASEAIAHSLRAAWRSLDPERMLHARYPVELLDGDFYTVAGGKHVARIVRSDDGDRVLGAIHAPYSVEALWVAVQATESRDTGHGVTQTLLPSATKHHRLLFLHMDSPWPMQNRQAVVDVRFNAPLFKATGGTLWERFWAVGDPELAVTPDEDALWMPANEGAWEMLSLEDGSTLAVVSLRVDVGGAVPTEAAVRWGVATLGSMLKDIVAAAAAAPRTYVGSHPVVYRPDGQPIPRGSL